jgi:hypothetical protein
MKLLTPTTVRVAGHFLELDVGGDGGLVGWRLLCGGCLAPRVTTRVSPPLGPRPGLPVDGALRLPPTSGWPAATLAWGVVGDRCDHPRPRPCPRQSAYPDQCCERDVTHPVSGARRVNRVVFLRGWLRAVERDPVLVPGGLWVSVAPGHATRVHTDAFGVRQTPRKAARPWQKCPA